MHTRTLDRVQRLIMGGIAGSMRTTPTVALEVLLDIPPLSKVIRASSLKTCCRLEAVKACRLFLDDELATEILSDGGRIGLDRMTERILFNKPYQVILPDREEWSNGTHAQLENGIVWFTDGSKTSDGVGTGAWEWSSTQEIVCSLDSYATVFQAELRAIREYAVRMHTTGTERCLITICSDSKAALQVLDAISITCKEVTGCREALETLSEKNGVRLLWVPGHSGIPGNDRRVDSQAGVPKV